MTAEETLDTCRQLGLTVRAEGDQLYVAPPAKLTPELREQIRSNKESILTLLQAPFPENPRSIVKRLEKELGVDQPDPSAVVFLDYGECEHREQDIATAIAILKRERVDRGYDTSQGLCFFLSMERREKCDICLVLKRRRP